MFPDRGHEFDQDKPTPVIEAMGVEGSIQMFYVCWIDVTWKMLDSRHLERAGPSRNSGVKGLLKASDIY